MPPDPPSRPTSEPGPTSEPAWRSYALAYLRLQLANRAPSSLGPAAWYDASVLEGDGPVMLFPYSSAAPDEPGEFYVVVGHTAPNYYPRWSLTLDEAFRVHLGTRFMLVVGVSQAGEAERNAFDPAVDLARIVSSLHPDEKPQEASLVALFKVGTELHAVCRCRIAGDPIYVLAGDCPPGFYRRTELPPHVVYRLHLGSLLLNERPEPE